MAHDEQHLGAALGLAMDGLRSRMMTDDLVQVRPSQIRVIEAVPEDGCSVTALAEAVGMTKQAAAQFVSRLVERGWLALEADPADGRRKLVTRTAAGERTHRQVVARLGELERELAERCGPRRWATFRAVLAELAADPANPLT